MFYSLLPRIWTYFQVRVYSNEEHKMEAGYFFSDEPGYYEKGNFGIRLETVLMTVEKNDLPYGRKSSKLKICRFTIFPYIVLNRVFFRVFI